MDLNTLSDRYLNEVKTNDQIIKRGKRNEANINLPRLGWSHEKTYNCH